MVSATMSYPEQHHPTLYFEDGNVVLSGEGKDGRCYFRVHQSVLCRHSPTFADMFAIPPLTEEGPDGSQIAETYSGVLHIQMPDSAEDLGSLLGVLYDPLYVTPIASVRASNDRALIAQRPGLQTLQPRHAGPRPRHTQARHQV